MRKLKRKTPFENNFAQIIADSERVSIKLVRIAASINSGIENIILSQMNIWKDIKMLNE